jgi:hypothetical protein
MAGGIPHDGEEERSVRSRRAGVKSNRGAAVRLGATG